MGKRVSNKCFRDPTAERVFYNEGIKGDTSERDEVENSNVKIIAPKEKRFNEIPYYPFYDMGRETEK